MNLFSRGCLGRLGDASLPFDRQQDVRPIFVFLDQSSPNWVLQDVIAFLPPTFISAQAMIEKVALPINLGLVRGEALPACNNIRHLHIHGEGGEEMNIIRHQKNHVNKPSLLAVVKLRRLE
jgi:hypothetical protein